MRFVALESRPRYRIIHGVSVVTVIGIVSHSIPTSRNIYISTEKLSFLLETLIHFFDFISPSTTVSNQSNADLFFILIIIIMRMSHLIIFPGALEI